MAVYTPLQQKAYEYLKDKVVSGKLDKGQVYSESYFAKELKMSRTPVREALQRLVQEGYIDVLPSRGFVVHPLTESDIVAMYQMRTAIECFCLSHYANHRDEPETVWLLSLLRENLVMQRQCQTGSLVLSDFYKFDYEFHRLLIVHMNNSWFNEAFEKYAHTFETMTRMTMNCEDRICRSINEHEEICTIIEQGGSREVFDWMYRHVAFPTTVMLGMLKNS